MRRILSDFTPMLQDREPHFNGGCNPVRAAIQERMHSSCCSGVANRLPAGKTRSWSAGLSQGASSVT